MRVTSIDNCYETDGLTNLLGTLGGLNAQPAGPDREEVVAILPEYDDDGRLNRLNVCTVQNREVPGVRDSEAALIQAADAVTRELQARRAEAYLKADRPIGVE